MARQWSAKPSTAVRIRSTPQKRFNLLKRFLLQETFPNPLYWFLIEELFIVNNCKNNELTLNAINSNKETIFLLLTKFNFRI